MKIFRSTMAALSASIIATGIGCLVSLPAGSQAGSAQAQAGSAQAQLVDAAGNMHIPDNYRINYEYLGSWSVAGDEKGAKEMHTVYASPGAAEAYRATGKFPDGSVLVKEVQSTATAAMTTGTVSHVDRLKGWFVMVKDSRTADSLTTSCGVTAGAGPGLMLTTRPRPPRRIFVLIVWAATFQPRRRIGSMSPAIPS